MTIFFSLQRHAARDFWFVKLNACLRTLTFNAEVLSEAFSLVVNRVFSSYVHFNILFKLWVNTSCLTLFLGFSPRVARKRKRRIFEKSKSEQPAGTVHEMQ